MSMLLTAVAAEGFRNLANIRLAPSPRFNILEGDNGQGKTNLLEVIYLLSTFKSFRDARNSHLIAFDAPRAVVRGEIVRREVRRTVDIAIGPKGKRVTLDGKTITRVPAAFSHFNVVLFGPDDLSLTKAGPDVRRRFLNRAVFSIWPEYLARLRSYRTALASRNGLLRQHVGRSLDEAFLAAFESELVKYAAALTQLRLAFIARFRPHFEHAFSEITGSDLSGALAYRDVRELGELKGPSAQQDVAALTGAYQAALDRARAVDRKRGFTSVGPHTADVSFTINGRPTRIFASQGQHRAFVLALKIAEWQGAAEAIGAHPVFLLDDVSSELDQSRNAQLMGFLDSAGGQVFITTTDRRWIQVQASRVYRVRAGEVIPA